MTVTTNVIDFLASTKSSSHICLVVVYMAQKRNFSDYILTNQLYRADHLNPNP